MTKHQKIKDTGVRRSRPMGMIFIPAENPGCSRCGCRGLVVEN